MTAVAVASSSRLSADAGAAVAESGGNAVDAAVAACLVSMTTEPGVCALGAGGYVTVWSPGEAPVTIDGYAAVPGLGLADPRAGDAAWEVELSYGGGVKTVVGYGSVGVPGGLAAMGRVSERYGELPWGEVVEPAREIAIRGFPLPSACYQYLVTSGELVYGWDSNSRGAFFDAGNRMVQAGEVMRLPHLADTLERIAKHGVADFYTGDLGHAIADYVHDHGGALNRKDMAEYRAVERPSLEVALDEWHIASNPAPAVGGATLGAMLLLMRSLRHDRWDAAAVKRLVDVQHAVTRFRHDRLDQSEDMKRDVEELLKMAATDTLPGTSGSTVHTSVVDSQGLGCSITMSSGYGAGAVPPGTGIWLNNCLGELELNRGGFGRMPLGARLISNMAPTVARSNDGRVLATGSPGADRITTAILQVLVNYMHLDMPLEQAVAHPRAHVEIGPEGYRVAYEAGLPMEDVQLPLRRFDELSMFFGGASAAEWNRERGFTVAGDPRRQAGTAIAGRP
jgi:gamma-glutamyltranspeptidase/glutathione hydrolase